MLSPGREDSCRARLFVLLSFISSSGTLRPSRLVARLLRASSTRIWRTYAELNRGHDLKGNKQEHVLVLGGGIVRFRAMRELRKLMIQKADATATGSP
jgi:hypothetical protein